MVLNANLKSNEYLLLHINFWLLFFINIVLDTTYGSSHMWMHASVHHPLCSGHWTVSTIRPKIHVSYLEKDILHVWFVIKIFCLFPLYVYRDRYDSKRKIIIIIIIFHNNVQGSFFNLTLSWHYVTLYVLYLHDQIVFHVCECLLME